MAKTHYSQQGFTLIELIVVIVLLGILSVVALPRFVDFSEDAHLSTTQAVSASFQQAVDHAHLRWNMLGKPGRIQNMEGFGDGQLDMSTNGFPIGIDKGNGTDNVGQQAKGCYELWNYMIQDGPRALDNATTDFQSYRHTGNNSCSYVLRTNGDSADRTNARLGILYNSVDGSVQLCGNDQSVSC